MYRENAIFSSAAVCRPILQKHFTWSDAMTTTLPAFQTGGRVKNPRLSVPIRVFHVPDFFPLLTFFVSLCAKTKKIFKNTKHSNVKQLLIIYPHWPPSNLAGVHRARLISNFLPEMGWQPTVLTVKPDFYEEPPDHDLTKTVASTTVVKYVDARPVPRRLRFIGDIALRAFSHLERGALQHIRSHQVDFIWIPIPAYYTAILGRRLHEKTGIPYGIDYIDPWVNGFPGQDNVFSRAWLSNQLAKILEPYSVKKASLISGVSTPYYQEVLHRNFKNCPVEHVGMPYGFDPADHQIRLNDLKLPWYGIENCKPIVYAGAFLPKSHVFVQKLFAHIKQLHTQNRWDSNVHLFFLGTGNYLGKTFARYAQEYGIEACIHEIPQRFPFLHILNFLAAAYGVMIIGSTEKHYTASKTFQSLLSGRPVFAVFHHESSAVEVMQEAAADQYTVQYNEAEPEAQLEHKLAATFDRFLAQTESWNPQPEQLNAYSAKVSAQKLVEKLNKIVSQSG